MKQHHTLCYKTFSTFIAITFASNVILPPGYAQLLPQTVLNLPAPGTMISLSDGFAPTLIKGITINPDNPLQFDFFISKGDENLEGEALKTESRKLIKYFLASLTVPEEELWVNLSPYEKDRIIPQGFGETEMGRDLLAQDYILKQLTASLMYPEKELGSAFWKKIYQKAKEQYGTTEIPMDTFNKVWIVPDKAVVYEHGNSVFVVESHLKVMLEQDYQAMGHNVTKSQGHNGDLVTTQIIREVILPALEKEVNEGKSFANLRQIYNSSVLAVWYKQNLKQSLLARVYADKNKTKGIDVADKDIKEKIYNQYLEAFKKGVYNYIKEDYDPATQNMVPRKYFSGGTSLVSSPITVRLNEGNTDQFTRQKIAKEMSGIVRAESIVIENTTDETAAAIGSSPLERPLSDKDYIRDIIKAMKEALPSEQEKGFAGLLAKLTDRWQSNGANVSNRVSLLHYLLTEKDPVLTYFAPRLDLSVERVRQLKEFLVHDIEGILKASAKDFSNVAALEGYFKNAFGKVTNLTARHRQQEQQERLASSPIQRKMAITDLSDSAFSGKTVFIRPDFNVPIKNGVITDDSRIAASLETITYALQRGAKVVIGAHLGDPLGDDLKKRVAELHKAGQGLPENEAKAQAKQEISKKRSLAPVAERLEQLLGVRVYFDPSYKTPGQMTDFIKNTMHPGEVLLLENIRFNPGEKKNDPAFIQDLYDGVDLAIIDGFGVVHRDQASVARPPKNIPRVAGFLLRKEVNRLQNVKENADTVIIGGSKVSGKIGLIDTFLNNPRVQHVLIGGGMANAFLKARYGDRISLGKSIGVDPGEVAIAAELMNNPKIMTPIDFVIASEFSPNARHEVITLKDLIAGKKTIPESWLIIDIGPQTATEYGRIISQSKNKILNGPMGVFELDFAAQGTFSVLRSIADSEGDKVIGGGDSGDAVKKSKIDPNKFYVSTGGGASLELLEGKVLPGIAALSDRLPQTIFQEESSTTDQTSQTRGETGSSPVVLPRVVPTETASWSKLKELSQRKYDLRESFKEDPERARHLSVALDAGFKVDFSKNLIDEQTLSALINLASETKLKEAIEQMFTGEKINETENRAVLHTALRNVRRDTDGHIVAANGPVYVDGVDIMPAVIAVLNKMNEFTTKVRSGEWKGATDKRIKHVVNIGIGGSDLGPKMAAEALKPYGRDSGITAHFISNIDGTAAAELMRELGNPEQTLFVIESKTFTTQETIQNAVTFKNWVVNYYKGKSNISSEDAIKKHFVAVSTAKELVEAFGIDSENMFVFWDWVGGRYSMWSAIGLTLATYIGFDKFFEMLEGAREADEHFRNQPFEKNIPVIKALLGVWNRNFLNAETYAILPYDQYLSLLPAFLQQGFMESQGKGTDRSGKFITDYKTGQILWGAAGTDGQHSFYQLIHQSPSIVPADFIGIARTKNPLPGHHEKFYSNFVAQPYALAFGSKLEEVMKALDDGKMSPEELRWLAAHQTFPGNKPTTSIFIDEMTPSALGKLIAMYEHQIMAEGIIYNIFSFDQWGVQLGKVVATKNVLNFLNGTRPLAELDSVPYGHTIRDVAEEFISKQPRKSVSSPVKVTTKEELKTIILDIAVLGISPETTKAKALAGFESLLEEKFDQLKEEQLELTVESGQVTTNIKITLDHSRKMLFVERNRGSSAQNISTHADIQLEGEILEILASSPVGNNELAGFIEKRFIPLIAEALNLNPADVQVRYGKYNQPIKYEAHETRVNPLIYWETPDYRLTSVTLEVDESAPPIEVLRYFIESMNWHQPQARKPFDALYNELLNPKSNKSGESPSVASPVTEAKNPEVKDVGGIDLNPALLDLQIKRDGNGVPLPLPQQPIGEMRIDGFVPVIINITPVTNLPLLLGLADTEEDTDEASPAFKAREPEELSSLN